MRRGPTTGQHMEDEMTISKQSLDEIISDLEDAKTSLEEVRADEAADFGDERLDDVESTLERVIDRLEESSDSRSSHGRPIDTALSIVVTRTRFLKDAGADADSAGGR